MIHAAEDDRVVEAGEDAELFGVLVDLHGEFPGGGEYQRPGPARLAVFDRMIEQPGEDRQQEGGGFSGSGLGFSGEVASFEQRGQGHRLNRRAVFKPGILDAELHLRVEREIKEAGLAFTGRHIAQFCRMFRSGSRCGFRVDRRFAFTGRLRLLCGVFPFRRFSARLFLLLAALFAAVFVACFFPALTGIFRFAVLFCLNGDGDGAGIPAQQGLQSFFQCVQHDVFSLSDL